MTTTTVRELRTRFPRVKALIEREGEVVVTDRGRPAYLLRAYRPPSRAKTQPLNYFARLRSRQPRPLTAAQSRALDEADRGER